MCELRTDHAHSSLRSRLSAIRAMTRHSHDEALGDELHVHPSTSAAGVIELDDADLGLATGGMIGTCSCQCSCHCTSVK